MRMKKQKKPAAREFHQFDSTMRKLLVAREMLPFASVRMLASIIGVSAPHVVRLLQEFRRGGFLREERASVVDPVRLGLKMEALVEVRCRQVHVDKLAKEIEAQLPQLRRVWTVASEADLVASVMVRDSDHLLSTLKALEKSSSPLRKQARGAMSSAPPSTSWIFGILH